MPITGSPPNGSAVSPAPAWPTLAGPVPAGPVPASPVPASPVPASPVPARPARRSRSRRERTRSANSAAAFLVKVRPSTRSGRTIPLATSQTSRAAIVSLLPEPAPAMTASGPSGAEITAACSGVGSGSRSSRASWVGGTGPIWLAPSLTVVTITFQQRPLTFRAGTST